MLSLVSSMKGLIQLIGNEFLFRRCQAASVNSNLSRTFASMDSSKLLKFEVSASVLTPFQADFPEIGPKNQKLEDLFVNLERSSKVQDFIVNRRVGLMKTLLHRLLTSLSNKSDFDINGFVDIYPLHIFTSQQLMQFLEFGLRLGDNREISNIKDVLDVGSGVGQVTDELNKVFRNVITTEMSTVMCNRLQKKGYISWNEDISYTYSDRINEGYTFDMISLLNVIDRTPRPISLLRAAHSLLRPHGLLLLATPLPLQPFYFTHDHKISKSNSKKFGKPSESLDLLPSNTWEDQATELIEKVIPKMNFVPIAYSRLPYVSGGDYYKSCTVLDDIIILAKKI